jgi:hypothetical protein
MATWKVHLTPKWGAMPGRLVDRTITVQAGRGMYGEAIQRAARKVVEEMYEVTAYEDTGGEKCRCGKPGCPAQY